MVDWGGCSCNYVYKEMVDGLEYVHVYTGLEPASV